MVRSLIIVLSMAVLVGCKQESSNEPKGEVAVNSNSEYPEGLEVYDFKGLEPLLNQKGDKTYVVNFWATWCKPCIKELPYFEEINRDFKEKNVEVLLVSLDFPNQYEKKLIPYIKDNGLKSKVVALDDPNMNSWIPKVNENWTGAIPATIIYNSNERQFYEGSFTKEELMKEIRKFIEK